MNGEGVVLIVDDHAPLARSLVSLLSASGFDAQAVHSGTEALAFVHSHGAVALILLDMSMPDMSGVDVLRTMRVPGGGSPDSPPVLMFLEDDDQATRDELIQFGATGFVSKTNPGGLVRTVTAYVRPTKPQRA
jgi:two-component system response regulator PrrA